MGKLSIYLVFAWCGALALACGRSEARKPAPPTAEATPVQRRSEPQPGADPSATTTGPVIVELFTSQGCSSCPPADRLLSEIGKESNVIALAYHVDYWNYIGWADPFSSAEWSSRQRTYAGRLQSQVYTPQLVVHGRTHVVGSNTRAVRDAVDAQAVSTPVQLVATARRDGDRAQVAARVNARDDAQDEFDTDAEDLELVVALYENGHQTDVTAGENRGRSLHNNFVVRRLARMRPLAGQSSVVDIPIEPTWNGALGVAVWLQSRDTMAIYAATKTAL